MVVDTHRQRRRGLCLLPVFSACLKNYELSYRLRLRDTDPRPNGTDLSIALKEIACYCNKVVILEKLGNQNYALYYCLAVRQALPHCCNLLLLYLLYID